MTDFLIENDGLVMKNGDFVLVDGIDEIKQHIKVALNTRYLDSPINPYHGIDYPFALRNLEFLKHETIKQISSVKGVEAIDDLSLSVDKETQIVHITARIQTQYGTIPVDEKVKVNEEKERKNDSI